MAKRNIDKILGVVLIGTTGMISLSGCQVIAENPKTKIEIVSYKQEAVDYFV